MMGSTDSEIDEAFYECKKYNNECKREGFIRETPRHKVTFKEGFWMGKYEVTGAEYQKIMGQGKLSFDPTCPECPATTISWTESKEFIQKLNAKNENFVYSLPSEAEWEYAARAGTTTAFAFGNSLDSSQANFDGNYPYKSAAKLENHGRVTSVRQYQPNEWGLFNMHGNVWEWCEDIYNSTYSNLPTDGSANLSVGDSKNRVLRSGSFTVGAYLLRSASRVPASPLNIGKDIGFRVIAYPK